MTAETPPSSDIPADPALVVAERQLVMLGELAQLAMVMSRAYTASGVASVEAAKAILTDKYFVPEVGRANACGAKDAAESFQKVTRALRLTLMLETTTAEYVRDLRAGVVPHSNTKIAAAHGAKPARLVIDENPAPSAPRPEADSEGKAAGVERPGGERERLVDIEHADRLPKGSYCRLVDNLAADAEASVDWETTTVSAQGRGDVASSPNPPKRTDLGAQGAARREPEIEPQRYQERQGVRPERMASG